MTTKKFHWSDDHPPIVYRPGTSDEAIINTVLLERREYLFPKFEPKIVFDIGANIGVVSVILSQVYPTAKIHAFEPVQSNYELLELNTLSCKNVSIHNCGLGADTGEFRIYKSTDPTNLGGFSQHIKGENDPGELIKIKDVATVCKELGGPDLIKIDVEGAEDDILTYMPNLDRVKWITGELHGVNDFLLLDHLNKNFRLQFARNFGDVVWHFHALNKSWADFGRDPSSQS